MTRLRDLGVTLGRLPAGPENAITDVPGVRVGHVTLTMGDGPLVPGQGPVRTGVTAIVPHGGDLFQEPVACAVHTINGFGKVVGFEQVHPYCTGVATYMSGAHLLDRSVMHNPVNLASEHLHPH